MIVLPLFDDTVAVTPLNFTVAQGAPRGAPVVGVFLRPQAFGPTTTPIRSTMRFLA
jgi:hypothetical protein